MTQKMSVAQWTDSLPQKTQNGLTVAMVIAGKWYGEIEESPYNLFETLEFAGISGSPNVLVSVIECLRLVFGPHKKDIPEPARDFLIAMGDLILHALKSLYRRKIRLEMMYLVDGIISIKTVENNINALILAEIVPASSCEAFKQEVSVGMRELSLHVIGESVEAHARRYLESGEVKAGHPAFLYLSEIVRLAPKTRVLPEAAAAALATFMSS